MDDLLNAYGPLTVNALRMMASTMDGVTFIGARPYPDDPSGAAWIMTLEREHLQFSVLIRECDWLSFDVHALLPGHRAYNLTIATLAKGALILANMSAGSFRGHLNTPDGQEYEGSIFFQVVPGKPVVQLHFDFFCNNELIEGVSFVVVFRLSQGLTIATELAAHDEYEPSIERLTDRDVEFTLGRRALAVPLRFSYLSVAEPRDFVHITLPVRDPYSQAYGLPSDGPATMLVSAWVFETIFAGLIRFHLSLPFDAQSHDEVWQAIL